MMRAHTRLLTPVNLTIFVTEMYYGGEGLTVEQPQAFTCPYCGRQGLTEGTLQEHVASEHADTSFEVVSSTTGSLLPSAVLTECVTGVSSLCISTRWRP
jgi:hypothetical protein